MSPYLKSLYQQRPTFDLLERSTLSRLTARAVHCHGGAELIADGEVQITSQYLHEVQESLTVFQSVGDVSVKMQAALVELVRLTNFARTSIGDQSYQYPAALEQGLRELDALRTPYTESLLSGGRSTMDLERASEAMFIDLGYLETYIADYVSNISSRVIVEEKGKGQPLDSDKLMNYSSYALLVEREGLRDRLVGLLDYASQNQMSEEIDPRRSRFCWTTEHTYLDNIVRLISRIDASYLQGLTTAQQRLQSAGHLGKKDDIRPRGIMADAACNIMLASRILLDYTRTVTTLLDLTFRCYWELFFVQLTVLEQRDPAQLNSLVAILTHQILEQENGSVSTTQ